MTGRNTLLLAVGRDSDRAFFRSLLEEEYHLLEAETGARALLLAEQFSDSIAAVLLDAVLPGQDGYSVLAALAERNCLRDTPVIMLAAENEIRALELGASDNIRKPFQPGVIVRRVRNLVELSRHRKNLEELVESQARQLRQSNEAVLDALISVIEYRSLESGLHARRTRFFTRALLEQLAQIAPEYELTPRKIELISGASPFHDIGKIVIPDTILNKRGPLSANEYAVMKSHTLMGCRILSRLSHPLEDEYFYYADLICRYHHERWDGLGYPEGLEGDQIPICAQVVGLVDAYDALTNDRIYKKAIPHEQAVNMLLNGECGQFSPKLLECLKRARDIFRDLSLEHTDSNALRQTPPCRLTKPAVSHSESSIAWMSQEKYWALLRYVEATVVEVDLESSIYHLVYAPNPDLALLRTGSTFTQSMDNLTNSVVHPDDRDMVRDNGIEFFFSRGLQRRTRRYRILHSADGSYRWYDVTTIRLAANEENSRKALILWQESPSPGMPRLDSSSLQSLVGGMLRCRNDHWYTISGSCGGLAGLLGYSQEELHQRFHDRLLDLVHPEDQEDVIRKTNLQISRGNTTELEYRMMHRDGRVIWVLEKSRLVVESDGMEYFYCTLTDVTRTKQAQEDLRLTLERHQIILSQTNDIIFEWDLQSDRVEYSSNWEQIFGYLPHREHASLAIPESPHLHPEDAAALQAKMLSLQSGTPYEEMDLRIAKSDSQYLWCRVRATAQADKDGHPIKVVGAVVNIDRETRATLALQARAERDALTGLYNKTSSRRQIEEYLATRPSTELAALLIIDADDFKHINDNYGHMFGDTVLSRISEEICHLFRNMDVISRIGGDEFLVFLRNIPDKALVQDRCQKLVNTLSQLFQDKLPGCGLSCSVGVALVPEHGTDYATLFLRADQALYQAKGRGKRQYALYSGAGSDFSAPTAAGTRIESDQRLPELETRSSSGGA